MPVINRNYGYTPAGDIELITYGVAGNTRFYAYDNLHRLTSEWSSADEYPYLTPAILDYAYDPAGPLHGVSAITRLDTPHVLSYDANGNMIQGPDLTDVETPQTRGITWNADNMPVAVSHASLGATQFFYDGDQKRAKKVSPSGTADYYVDTHFEIKAGSEIKYVFAGNLRVAKIESGQIQYFHKDHLGSSTAMTDANGTAVETAAYLPYGRQRGSQEISVTSYKFTDQELDAETGLYNYDARLYDPIVGRFVSADTVVPKLYDPQTIDRYAYCRNNPIIYNDPSGHRLQVGAHTVFGAMQHTSITITLDTPDIVNAFGNNPNFQNTNSLGQQYATIGAEPVDGRLRSDINRPKDLDLNIKNEMVDIDLQGRNEIDAINGLFQSDANYDDMLDYGLFPDGITSYNSNSYTSGLLDANNLQVPTLQSTTPGYRDPVSAGEFSGVGIDGSGSGGGFDGRADLGL